MNLWAIDTASMKDEALATFYCELDSMLERVSAELWCRENGLGNPDVHYKNEEWKDCIALCVCAMNEEWSDGAGKPIHNGRKRRQKSDVSA